MNKYTFISTFRYLSIPEPINGWLTLMPGIDITNDKKLISKVINQEFKEVAGAIEHRHFINADNIIYCEIDGIFLKNESSEQALFIWLSWLKMLLTDLWFIKDHSVICEAAFCKLTNKNKNKNKIQDSWTRNYLTNPTFSSSGVAFKTTEISVKELGQWDEKSCQVRTYLSNENSTSINSFTNTKFSRVGRSIRFIEAAMKESHPAVKIAHYCSAFESLFSTDSAELSHKLSERVAIFLKDYGFNPVEVFDDIKSFYGVRSKVIHGDSLKTNKENLLSDMSVKCDSYLRVVLNALVNDKSLLSLFDGEKDKFENFFKHKLFMIK